MEKTPEEKSVLEMTVKASVDQIFPVTEFVNAKLAALGCSDRIRMQVDVAIDEIFSNIARYAYGPKPGSATVRVDVEQNPLSVVITFIDHGKPYDPLAVKRPDTTALPASQRPIGGLGLFIVKEISLMEHTKCGFDNTDTGVRFWFDFIDRFAESEQDV